MSSEAELFSETINDEWLRGAVHHGIQADSSHWHTRNTLRSMGRGPHTLPLVTLKSHASMDTVKVGEIEFEFIVNPEADLDREPFYIVKPESVTIRLWPAEIPKVAQMLEEEK